MAKSKTDTKALEQADTTQTATPSFENLTPTQQAHSIAVEAFETITHLFSSDDFNAKGIAGFFFCYGAEKQLQYSTDRLNQLEHEIQVWEEDEARDNASATIGTKRSYAKREADNCARLRRMVEAAREAYFITTGERWTPKPKTEAKKEKTEADRVAEVMARRAR